MALTNPFSVDTSSDYAGEPRQDISSGAKGVVRQLDEAQSRDPLAEGMSALTKRKTQLGYAKQAAEQLRDTFLDTEGADLFERDPVTKKVMKGADGGYIPRLESEIEGLRKKSTETVGFLRGALTADVAGELTQEARDAAKQLAEREPLFKAKADKWKRIQDQLARIKKANDDTEMELGQYAAQALARNGTDIFGAPSAPTELPTQAQQPQPGAQPQQAPASPAVARPVAGGAVAPSQQGSSVAEQEPHRLPVAGSNPAPAPITPGQTASNTQTLPGSNPGEAVTAPAPISPVSAVKGPTPLQLVQLHKQMADARAIMEMPTTNENLREASRQKIERLKEMFLNGMAALPADGLRQRVLDITRDPTTGELVKNFMGRVGEGAGGALVDMAEFVVRNAKNAPNLILPGITALTPDYVRKQQAKVEVATREMTDAMREEAATWGLSGVPKEVAEKLGETFTGKLGQGVGSSLAFIAPTTAALRIGQLAGATPAVLKAIGLIVSGGAGAAASGNSLRREAEVNLAQMVQAGEITAEEAARGVDQAEIIGILAGATEAASPLARWSKKIAGVPAGQTLLKQITEKFTGGGMDALAKWLRGNGRRYLLDVVSEAGEEAFQELGQGYIENRAARGDLGNVAFDPNRDLGEGLAENAGTGGIVGAFVSAVLGGVSGADVQRQRRIAAAMKRGQAAGQQAKQAQAAQTPPPAVPAPTNSAAPATPGAVPVDPDLRAELEAGATEEPGAPVESVDGKTVQRWTFTDKDGKTASVDATGLKDARSKLPAGFVPDLKKAATQEAIAAPKGAVVPEKLEGDPIDKEWTAFSPESQSLGIPRAEMPQIKSEARGALTQFLKARDIVHEPDQVLPGQLKPTQAEYSQAKVDKAREMAVKFGGNDRPILVSSDNHVVDGHHQWMAALNDKPETAIPVIRLNAPIRDVLAAMKEFPSTQTASGATPTVAKDAPVAPAATEQPTPLPSNELRSLAARVIYDTTEGASNGQVKSIDDIEMEVTLLEEKLKRGRKLTVSDIQGITDGSVAHAMWLKDAIDRSPEQLVAALREAIDRKKQPISQPPAPAPGPGVSQKPQEPAAAGKQSQSERPVPGSNSERPSGNSEPSPQAPVAPAASIPEAPTAPVPAGQITDAGAPQDMPEARDFQITAPPESAAPAFTASMDGLKTLRRRIVEGSATPDEIKSAWSTFKAGRNQLLKELTGMKKEEVMKFASISARASDTKASLVKSALSNLQQLFVAGSSVSYNPMTDTMEKAIDRQMDQWTPEVIAKAKADRDFRRAQQEKELTNPETLSEFEGFISYRGRRGLSKDEIAEADKLKGQALSLWLRARGERMLSPDQRARYEALKAEATRGRRLEQDAEAKTVPAAALPDGAQFSEVIDTKHTQKGHAIFVVKLNTRVEREAYDALNTRAKRLGGSYSSYAKDGAIPGFQFKTRDAAEQFRSGEEVSGEQRMAEKQETRQNAAATRLRELGQKQIEAGNEKMNADRKVNTARRVRQASSAEADAAEQIRIGETMLNLASAIEGNEVTFIDRITTKAHVEELDTQLRRAQMERIQQEAKIAGDQYRISSEREKPITAEDAASAKFPMPYADHSNLMRLVAAGRGKAGAKLAADRVQRLVLDRRNPQTNGEYLADMQQVEAVRELAEKVSKTESDKWGPAKSTLAAFDSMDRLARMEIRTEAELRSALREYVQYRGGTKQADPVKVMERELVGKNIPGFFPTPPTLAREMVDRAGIVAGMSVLEPSAGKGDLADAVKETQPDVKLTLIEPSGALTKILAAKGYEVTAGADFLRFEGESFDRVVMNPPFENGQDIDHVRHAYGLLKPGGKLVAIMSEGPFFQTSKKATEFRAWLESVNGTSEKNPDGSFAADDAFRQTGVNTRMVEIEKPEAASVAEPQSTPSAMISPEESRRLDEVTKQNNARVVSLTENQMSQVAKETGLSTLTVTRLKLMQEVQPDDLKAALDVVLAPKPKEKAAKPATGTPMPDEAAADYEEAKTRLRQSPNTSDAVLVKARQEALDRFTKKYAGKDGNISIALRNAARLSSVQYTEPVQRAIESAATPLPVGATFKQKQAELAAQITAAMRVAPVLNPNEVNGSNAKKEAQRDLDSSSLTAEDLETRKVVAPQAVGTITITAGSSKMRFPADYVTLEKMRRRIEKSIGKPTNPVPRDPGATQGAIIEGYEKAKTDAERRGYMDGMSEASLTQLGLSDKFERVAPGVVMPKDAAQALRDLKDGKQTDFDLQASTGGTRAVSNLDPTSPASFDFGDAAPGDYSDSSLGYLREFEDAINAGNRRAGLPDVYLRAQSPEFARIAIDGNSLQSGGAPNDQRLAGANRFRRGIEEVFGKRIIFFRSSNPVSFDAMTAGNRANVILVNADSASPLSALVGHEIGHNIQAQNPAVWGEMWNAITEIAGPPSDAYRRLKASQGYDTAAKQDSEWASDVLGQRFDEPEFWQEVEAAAKRRGARDSFASFVARSFEWLNNLARRIRRVFTVEADRLAISQIGRLRAVLADQLVRYQQEGAYANDPTLTGATDSELTASTGGIVPVTNEALAEQPARVQKPEPVKGKPGWFYRSEPDSLRAVGLRVVRQIYQRRPQAMAQELAEGILEAVDSETAQRLALDKNDNGVPGDVKTLLYGELVNRQAKILADSAASDADKARARRRIQQLDAVKAPQFTEAGQEISALQKVYKNARAAGMGEFLENARRDQEAAIGGKPGMNGVEEAADTLNKVNAEKVDKAIEGADKALAETPLSKALWQKYRERAAQQVFDWIDGIATPADEMAPIEAFTRRIVDEVRGRLKAEMPAADESDAVQPTAADLLREAVENKEKYAEAVATIRAKLVEEYGEGSPIIDQADLLLGNLGIKPYSKRLLDRAIKEAHDAMRTNFREIAKLHYTKADRMHRDMADALMEVAGLPEAKAKELTADLAVRMQELTAEAKKKALADLRKKFEATPRTRAHITAIQRAVLLNNYGALSVPEMADVVAKELKLPRVTPQQMQQIAQIAERVETATSQSDKSRAELDMLRALRIARGFSKIEIGTSIWYANMLSGYTTQMANVAGNMMQGTLQLATVMATNPKYAAEAFRGWVSGFGEGWEQAGAIMKTGRGSREFDANKAGEAGTVLELVDFKRDFPNMGDAWANARQKHVNAMRYVTRAMKAVDSVFYYPAREAYARVVTAKLLESQYEGRELYKRVREYLHVAPDQFARAKQQAEKEGFVGHDLALRVSNLIEERRRGTDIGTKASDASERFALESTYNNEPEGWAGVLYQKLVPLTQTITPGGIPVLRVFLPFLRVPTNVFNASMNYTPLGALRAYRGMPIEVKRGEDGKTTVERREFNDLERAQLLAQSIGGSLLMAGLTALALGAGGDDDEEEPWFTITATGPNDFKQRQQLEATGMRPHSIKIGDVWISYKDSPMLIPLAIVGHMVDGVRYGKQADESTLGGKLTDAVMTAPRAIFDTSMLSGLSTMMEFISGRSSAKQVQDFLLRTTAGTVVPNLLQQIDRTFSPEAREANGPLGSVGATIPFVRQTGDEKTDVLGEPIERSPLARFGGVEGNDPLREVLRDKGVFISVPQRSTKLGNAPMEERDYRDFVRISGERIRARLTPMVDSFRRQPKEVVERIVDRITQQEREYVKNVIRVRPKEQPASYNPFSGQ